MGTSLKVTSGPAYDTLDAVCFKYLAFEKHIKTEQNVLLFKPLKNCCQLWLLAKDFLKKEVTEHFLHALIFFLFVIVFEHMLSDMQKFMFLGWKNRFQKL